jgi:glycolate oxidase FAD binding subunit
LAEALRGAADAGQTMALGRAVADAEIRISLDQLTGVLQYEPRDLTISVQAGMRYAELSRLLAENQQMVPLDPPWQESATVGGVLAANLNGPRRRAYGTARDLVIGMTFATLEGKLVQSGGMVVKNVAGLDMAKLMIGSFGTLAAIATVNFKLIPLPRESRTLVLEFGTAAEALAVRDRILKSVLQPAAMDLLNPAAALQVGLAAAWTLLLRAHALPDRYARELPAARDEADAVWDRIREYTPAYLRRAPEGTVARYSTTHTGMRDLLAVLEGEIVARAASGVIYQYGGPSAGQYGGPPAEARYVLEHAPVGRERWPAPGSDFAMMKQIKTMLDPRGLLNRGQLYGRL